MSTFVKTHLDQLLIAGALLLIGIITIILVVTIRMLTNHLTMALNADGSATTPSSFDVEGAARLDLRGLTPGR